MIPATLSLSLSLSASFFPFFFLSVLSVFNLQYTPIICCNIDHMEVFQERECDKLRIFR